MKYLTLAMLTIACWVAMPARAGSATPAAAMARHVQAVGAADVNAIMADYADDAVLVTPRGMGSPTGVFVGKQQVREFFNWLVSPQNLPGLKSMVTSSDAISPQVVLLSWTQFKGTPQQFGGSDVFVFRKGKIVFQSVKPDK